MGKLSGESSDSSALLFRPSNANDGILLYDVVSGTLQVKTQTNPPAVSGGGFTLNRPQVDSVELNTNQPNTHVVTPTWVALSEKSLE